MKIKKLTIHGFKSFVDKVTLNFPSGTSGVIGPNGCGKSNIVDSIRWVLGEQNARHLRGKHMEDIIFNGSESRKPLGMAEVVLTFSNEDGRAPARFANFTEIEIARRLYRSGESEYYINKVQARLRDIVDLFTDTGIGSRAYSIIEQGQVGWLINAKPEERRAIFEEAAGINKFKHKKDAALRRLEATRENLTRVNDIISEVKRQLNSLNRQAKKAERYKTLREELTSIDLLLSSVEFGNLKRGLDSMAKKLESIKDEELGLTTSAGTREIDLEEIKAGYVSKESEYKSIREKVFELEKLIQNEERASELARVRAEELKRGEERLTSEIEELRKTQDGAGELIESLKATLGEIGSFIEEESKKLEENTRALNEIVSELRKKEDAQRAEKAESLKASTRLTDIRHAIQNLIRDEENLRHKESRSASERENIIKTLASREEPRKTLRENIDNAVSRRAEAEAELKSVRERLDVLEKERVQKTEELKKAKDAFAKSSARLATLEEMDRNYEGVKGGARAIMRKGKANGIHGLLADIIETNSGYEKAVEAVLGERLQYVLVESHKEGVEAIEYLKANNSGRGSFVPVRDARPVASPVPVGGDACPGAKELINEVRIKDGHQNIASYLLGDAIVVENLQSGLEIWRNNSIFKTIVTLDGELIDPQGTITGGSTTSDAGILQKRGEIKKIKAECTGLESRAAELDSAVKETEQTIRDTKTRLDEGRERLHKMDLQKVNYEGELRRLDEEISRLTRTRDTLTNDISDAGRRINDIGSRKASLSSERENLEKSVSEREARASVLSEETMALSQKKDGLNSIVTEIRVNLAQARERFESLKRQIADKERAIIDTEKRIETKRQEIERGKAEMVEKLKQADGFRVRLNELLSAIESIKKDETAKAEELDSISSRIRASENEIKEMKSRLQELQELKGEITIENKELELNMANLRDRVLEKYGKNIEPHAAADGEAAPDLDALEAQKKDLREKITSLGEVSLSALEEYADLERRHQFLVDQQTDLTKSVESLHAAITRINRTTREKFRSTFEEVNAKFQETFPRFFRGGKAELRLTEESDILEAGVEIVVQPPGKRLQNISLLSGGEKALTATSLIFAIFLIKPSPFCLLDEVDAPLDDANIDRFNSFVKDMSQISQFIFITHNKKTMEMADALYGITMEEPGISKLVTLKF